MVHAGSIPARPTAGVSMAVEETYKRAKTDYVVRVELSHGNARMNVYVDDHPHLHEGVEIELDGSQDGERWLVEAIHERVVRRSIKQGWNNNI